MCRAFKLCRTDITTRNWCKWRIFFYTSSCKHKKYLGGHKHYGWPTTHNIQCKNRTHTASCGLCATHAKYNWFTGASRQYCTHNQRNTTNIGLLTYSKKTTLCLNLSRPQRKRQSSFKIGYGTYQWESPMQSGVIWSCHAQASIYLVAELLEASFSVTVASITTFLLCSFVQLLWILLRKNEMRGRGTNKVLVSTTLTWAVDNACTSIFISQQTVHDSHILK